VVSTVDLLRLVARRLWTEVRQVPSLGRDLADGAASARRRATGPPANPIVAENRRPGTSRSDWEVRGAGDPSIQGFATDISVNAGATVSFKVDTDATRYAVEIFRLGYYRGLGARKVAEIPASEIVAQRQPAPLRDPSVGLVDCANWSVSARWRVPADAVSGVYLAKLTRADTGGASHIPFVVRDDARETDVLFQTSDTTWQAYNRYGGASFYTGSETDLWDSASRACKLSYNRPFLTRDDDAGRSYLFSAEYPAIQFLERNGYDVGYASGVDSDRLGPAALLRHRVFLSIGHDEYWSAGQRLAVEQARDAGVNLMFLSGNEMYWRTRYEPDADGTPWRTLVCYKDTSEDDKLDPSGEPTGTWRDPRLDGGAVPNLPENAVTGTLCMANNVNLPVTVTAAEGKLRLWRGTGLDRMRSAATALAPHTVGYESDEDVDNGFRPAGLIRLSTATGPSPEHVTRFGAATFVSTTTHHLTLYRAPSGGLVFSAGTIQWAWGLDRHHDGRFTAADRRIQQATVNMLADMGVQPGELMPGLVPASASTDHDPPTSTITEPVAGTRIASGSRVTVRGTAVDAGGGRVAGVEVSLDGGRTWHPAVGTESWAHTGILVGTGPVTILSRATDDSVNTETPGPGVTVEAYGACSLFGEAEPVAPAGAETTGGSGAAEVGVRFRAAVDGGIAGIRFFKDPRNAGVHVATLWTDDGVALATGVPAAETPSGWQTVQFPAPIPVEAGQTYVASYHAQVGHYSVTPEHFFFHDHVAGPLTAPAARPGGSGGNGVRIPRPGFPDGPATGENYHVDVLFHPTAADGAPRIGVAAAVDQGSGSGTEQRR
jgi:Domain of unknown function (DUF4082)/Bacterial Ig domain